MKININDIKFTPKHLEFDLCVHGTLSEELQEWCNYWKLYTYQSEEFTNISIPEGFDISNAFFSFNKFDYVDGFSPNLNKHLHVGHLSNLVYAKAFQKMQIGKKFIAVFGDTLDGDVKKDDALDKYEYFTKTFDYHVDKCFFASKLKMTDFSLLKNGEGKYMTTKIVEIDENKIVIIKSDGSTTYFYQDIAVAQELNASTLYLTGFEQSEHFANLKKLFPQTQHLGLGLVMLDGKKMSSSEGNVIYLQEMLDKLLQQFNDIQLVWNILAGMILKTEPKNIKNIDTAVLQNSKISPGLYISYTMAKMNSAGIDLIPATEYVSQELALKSLKSKVSLKPNFLMDAIVNQCKLINQFYETHFIKDNAVNKKMFQSFTSDLLKATSELGFFPIKKV